VLICQQTGVLSFSRILLVDGKKFSEQKKERQHFKEARNKAEERKEMWKALYPDPEAVPLGSVGSFVDRDNVGKFVREGTAVLLSPDNHPTRALVSQHVKTLDNCLLIVGGNDSINEEGGTNGSQGWVAVHCRVKGVNVTPPITEYHADLLREDEKLPTEMSCVELAEAGEPQLLVTNLFVGQFMSQLLCRYLTQPLRQAVEVVEVAVDSTSGGVGQYGIRERYRGTLFDQEVE